MYCLLYISLASCSSQTRTEALVSPASPTLSAPAPSEYRIRPLDTIQITVFNEPDLSRKTRVSAQSTINYPLLGTVELGGLTVLEAENKLAELLGRNYLVNPSVAVTVEGGNSRRVLVFGQVKGPGSIQISADETLTLLQLIARCGGFTDLAASDRVTIIRSENGVEKKIIVNVAAIIKSGDKSKDIELKADDVVSVPETFF
jgi:protein involved in polysaccharide export with SLBB domain